MKKTLFPFFLMLAAVPSFSQSTFQSFTPRVEADGTTYVNAEIVRVNADGTLTLRNETGDQELIADPRAVPGLAGLRRGDKVLVSFDTITGDNGAVRRVVTFARQASPTSGEPGPAFAAASASGSVVRVVSTNRARRTITVTDASGAPMVLPVSTQAARSLGSLNAGDVVGLDFTNGGIVSASALPSVSGFQILPTGSNVGSFVLPPVNGQFVRFDANTNRVTLQTASGRQRTFPVSNTVGGGLSGLRPGDNMSLNFQVTQEANRARVRAGGNTTTTTVNQAGLSNSGSGVLSVGSVQSLGAGSFQPSGAFVPAGSPIGPNTASPNAPGLTNVSTAAGPNVAGVTPGGINAVGGNAAGTSQVGSNAGVPGANTAGNLGGNGAAAGAGAANPGAAAGNAGGAGVPFTGGVTVASGVGASSPFANTVPSIPSPTPVLNAVLPPAVAKAPLSNEEVGAMRVYGERDLDNAAVVLAAYANEIDGVWARYLNGCLGGFTSESTTGRQWFLVLDGRVRTPNDDACRSTYTSLVSMATGWETQLGVVVDAARKADVLPGRIRETLDRHRIDR